MLVVSGRSHFRRRHICVRDINNNVKCRNRLDVDTPYVRSFDKACNRQGHRIRAYSCRSMSSHGARLAETHAIKRIARKKRSRTQTNTNFICVSPFCICCHCGNRPHKSFEPFRLISLQSIFGTQLPLIKINTISLAHTHTHTRSSTLSTEIPSKFLRTPLKIRERCGHVVGTDKQLQKLS